MGTHDIRGFSLEVVRHDNHQHNDRIIIKLYYLEEFVSPGKLVIWKNWFTF